MADAIPADIQTLAYQLGSEGRNYFERTEAIAKAIFAERQRAHWQTMDTAPKDKTAVIIAVPNRDMTGFIVGEAYFDPENYGDGDWWWAGTHHTDYHTGPIIEVNYYGPAFWHPLPTAPDIATLSAAACPTCHDTGKEARHQLCRDCDEVDAPSSGHAKDCEQRYHSCTCGYEARLEKIAEDTTR